MMAPFLTVVGLIGLGVAMALLLWASAAAANALDSALVGLIVLYNPVAPVEVGSKLVWSIISIGTVAWFWRLERRTA